MCPFLGLPGLALYLAVSSSYTALQSFVAVPSASASFVTTPSPSATARAALAATESWRATGLERKCGRVKVSEGRPGPGEKSLSQLARNSL